MSDTEFIIWIIGLTVIGYVIAVIVYWFYGDRIINLITKQDETNRRIYTNMDSKTQVSKLNRQRV